MQPPPSPSLFSKTFPDAEIFVVNDGPLHLGAPADNYPQVDQADLQAIDASGGFPGGEFVIQQNCLAVRRDKDLILIDTGTGPNPFFGRTTGRLLDNLARHGLSPSDVTQVLLTHPHLDHAGGILSADGGLTFPNATILVDEDDHRRWTDPSNFPSATPLQTIAAGVQAALTPAMDRLSFFRPGTEVLPGIHSFPTPGHTRFHSSFVLSFGQDMVAISGDVLHHPLAVKHPDWVFGGDEDGALAVASRRRFLEAVYGERMHLVSFHFGFPGYGKIAPHGSGFVFEPQA